MISFDRREALERLGADSFDVLVIGGGATGAGVALDAASRGLTTALVERHDFASGTSSKSSKMIHGGLRYLQQGDLLLVCEALHERQVLLRNAPHLVSVLPFLIPIYARGGLIPRVWSRLFDLVLWFYDISGGSAIGRHHLRLDKEHVVQHMPTLKADQIDSGYVYYDARADDARLTLTIARTAALDHGAAVVNYAPVTAFRKNDEGRVVGATVETDQGMIDVRASVVVDAAGVWVDDVETLDLGEGHKMMRPARGVHVVVPRSLVRNDVAVILSIPGRQGTVFVVPWGDLTYIGTTDTDYDGDLDDPHVTADDVAYLLGNLNSSIENQLEPQDVVGTWSGLRPLLREADTPRTADLSRHHRVWRSPSGVVNVAGGKLTTYRLMAEDTVDEVLQMLGREAPCRTKSIPLRGAEGWDRVGDGGLGTPMRDHLVNRYGADARDVIAMAVADPSLVEPLVPGLPYVRAEARYSAMHEMPLTLDDILARRTRARLLARDASADAAESVARLVGDVLGWSPQEQARQVASYQASVTAERDALFRPARNTTDIRPSEGWVPGVRMPRMPA